MTPRERNLLLYGTDELVTPGRQLSAGQLSATLDFGNLRHIRYGGTEIIRAISVLIRGPSWATYNPAIADLAIEESNGAFVVTYSASVSDGAQRLDYTARISGSDTGTLEFHVEMLARTAFETARAGFVVLHPGDVAGSSVRIEHADGQMVAGAFPLLIDPVQPMLNLRALTHEPAPGVFVTCRMDGDVFEMEDQRNWTDASFKTYVRPLSRPWPYTLEAGSRTGQCVTVQIESRAPTVIRSAAIAPVEIMPGKLIGEMPEIGLGCTPQEARAAMPLMATLIASGVVLLVCRFDPGQGHSEADLRDFQTLAIACGADVELQIVIHSVEGFAAELQRAADNVRAAGLKLRAIAVSPATDLKSVTPGQPWPECAPLPELYRAAREAFPAVALGGGMFSYFTELNRKRPDPASLDFITFSTSPLVHAGDDISVMETLEALPAVVASARAIAGGKPYVVGPSAIGLRDNPYGPTPLDNPRVVRQAMSGADPRQRGQFNAAWTLGYISRFAAGGAARIAVSAPSGPFGIADSSGTFPVFTVIQGCAALRGMQIHAAPTTCERDVLALLAMGQDRRELWLANLTPDPRTIQIPPMFREAHFCGLDVNVPPAGIDANPIEHDDRRVKLDSYAVLRGRATH